MNELQPIHRETDIIQWAEDRNIFEGGTAETQLKKFFEETVELGYGVEDDDIEEVKDGIGDVIVCLAIQAKFHGLTLTECIEHAWQQIKDRKGRLVDGVFQKESD
jgi:NTP pyrophosphatase (non-canonical NTP hydrolase)